MQVTVECQKRPEGINPRALRRQGLIPAALYGHKGAESISLTLKQKDAEILLKQASVNNTLVDVKVSDLSWSGKALIREVQSHPWKRTIYHLSFFSVATHGKIELVVPIELVGEPIGVKQGGGVMDQTISQLKIECAPENIPESITIDVSNLDIGDSLHVRELVVPEGVSVLEDSESMVFSILAPSKQEEASEA